MLTSVCAFADNEEKPDFSQLRDEDITMLYGFIVEEMIARGIPIPETKGFQGELNLNSGKYIIGEDIQPGTYEITCTSMEGENYNDVYSSLGGAYDSLMGSTGMAELFGSLGSMVQDLSSMKVEILGDYGTVMKSYEMKTGDKMNITLSLGTALQISDGSCTLK